MCLYKLPRVYVLWWGMSDGYVPGHSYPPWGGFNAQYPSFMSTYCCMYWWMGLLRLNTHMACIIHACNVWYTYCNVYCTPMLPMWLNSHAYVYWYTKILPMWLNTHTCKYWHTYGVLWVFAAERSDVVVGQRGISLPHCPTPMVIPWGEAWVSVAARWVPLFGGARSITARCLPIPPWVSCTLCRGCDGYIGNGDEYECNSYVYWPIAT